MKLYNELAEIVDISWNRKNYANEVKFIVDVFKKYKIKPKLIYDVACGSGPHSKLLLEEGFNVVGVDMNK